MIGSKKPGQVKGDFGFVDSQREERIGNQCQTGDIHQPAGKTHAQ
jgi:hypothetical protein